MKYNHLFNITDHNDHSFFFTSDEGEGKSIEGRLDFFRNILRVALVRNDVPLFPTYTVCPDGICSREGRDKLSIAGFETVRPDVKEIPCTHPEGKGKTYSFTTDYAEIELNSFNFGLKVSQKGKILFQDRDYISLNLGQELGRGSMHFISREFEEKIFGLGDKTGNVNKNGMSFKIGAGDAMGFDARTSDPLYKQLPFYICENSAGAYGIYYDTYSNGEISFGKELNNYYTPFKSFRCNEENLVYYVIFGTVPEIVRRFSEMCGPMLFPPKWTFKYCGSTMAYTDAPDADRQLRGFIDTCKKHGISPGGFYLSSGYTQIGEKRYVFHWNTDKVPCPEDLSKYFKDAGVEFLPNVKPAFLTDHPLYSQIAEKGWFLHYADGTPARFPFWSGYGSYLDFTNPDAYDFWRDCVKKQLVDKGYRNIWNDNNEYDVCDEEVWAHGFGHPVKACDIRPLFSFLMTMASLEAQDKSERTYSVSRCGIGGLQRMATTWTGDNRTGFGDFRFQHKMAMTMSLSGFYNFGQDIGGFAGPAPGKELFMRWIQYGLFTPRFTLHSWNDDGSSTMPWLYPDLISDVKKLFDLRESFIPYIYNEVYRSVKTHDPVIYPVFLKFPGYDTESDAFFFGDSILACPVFDEGATSVTVDLPKVPTGWYRGQNIAVLAECDTSAGGKKKDPAFMGKVTTDAPWTGLPVWFVKAGSIIPTAENGNTVFNVYALREGTFNFEYLDDDGISKLPENPPMIRISVECGEKNVTVRVKGNVDRNQIRITDCFGRDMIIEKNTMGQ
ncbi:MAG: hypothetical protein K6G60_00460 [Lachnospiraceae bacterium]|nr:hypothetical protein [Lachnospiraceae bacterium]